MQTSIRFEHCLTVVLGFEGGYSNDPADPGGITNLGITFDEWHKWQQQHGMKLSTIPEFRDNLTRSDVAPIYWENYWVPSHAVTFPPSFDMCVFDCAVNEGVGKAHQLLDATSDIKNVSDRMDAFMNLRVQHYNAIAIGAKAKFLPGWLSRVHQLQKMIGAGTI